MGDNSDSENEDLDHKTVVPEWPDVIKAKIAEAREHFAAFKAEMGCPDSDLVVYGTVVSSFEAEEHERGPLWWLTDVVSTVDGRRVDLPGWALYVGRLDLGAYEGKRVKAIVELAFEKELAKRGFALRARPLLTNVPEPEWEEINKSVNQLEKLKEEIEKKSHTKENIKQQLAKAKEKLKEAKESCETLKSEVGVLQHQMDVLKAKRSILGFEDAENQSDESPAANLSLKEIAEKAHAALVTSGGIYTPELIRDFTVLLATGDLIVLAGSSGSGKTSLCREYARVTGGVCHVIPVKPNWTSADDLLGFYSPIEKRFLTTPFLNALIEAQQDPDRLHIICLDEMNLARPEYYFADFLSVLEERSEAACIELNVPNRRKSIERAQVRRILEVIPDQVGPETSLEDLLAAEEVKAGLLKAFNVTNVDDLRNVWTTLQQQMSLSFEQTGDLVIPGNVRFVGTMNVDETTNFFALKILDRAQILQLTNPIFEPKPQEKAPKSTAPFHVSPGSFGRIKPYPKYSDQSLVVRHLKEIGEKCFRPLRVDLSLRMMRQAQLYESLSMSAGMSNKEILSNVVRHKLFPKCVFELDMNSSSAIEKLQTFVLDYENLLSPDCAQEVRTLIDMGRKNRSINWWLL